MNYDIPKLKYGFRYLEENEKLEIGDTILTIHTFGVNKSKVVRLTDKYSFAQVNETYTNKFPAIFNNYSFQPFPREKWNTSQYLVVRKIKIGE